MWQRKLVESVHSLIESCFAYTYTDAGRVAHSHGVTDSHSVTYAHTHTHANTVANAELDNDFRDTDAQRLGRLYGIVHEYRGRGVYHDPRNRFAFAQRLFDKV